MLIGGIFACLVSLAIAGATMCLWIPWIYGLVAGIMAIIKGIQLMGDVRPGSGIPTAQPVMLIINILNGDMIGMVMGIIALVLLNDPQSKAYLKGDTMPAAGHMGMGYGYSQGAAAPAAAAAAAAEPDISAATPATEGYAGGAGALDDAWGTANAESIAEADAAAQGKPSWEAWGESGGESDAAGWDSPGAAPADWGTTDAGWGSEAESPRRPSRSTVVETPPDIADIVSNADSWGEPSAGWGDASWESPAEEAPQEAPAEVGVGKKEE